MSSRRKLILAANAVPGRGGQGLNLQHMIEALRESFDMRVFCGRELAEVPGQAVRESSLARLIDRVPVVRRLRGWRTLLAERHFDRQVSQHLSAADIFQGVTGQCAESLPAARSLGCRTVLDVITNHVDDFLTHQRVECAKFGVRPVINLAQRERILSEYRNADLIRVMSRRARRTFLDRGFPADRVVAFPPPIEAGEFPQADFSSPKFRISFVGMIEPWKGFHYLIEAFNQLRLRDSELVLWGGPGARSINRYLQEQLARNPAIAVRPFSVLATGYGDVYIKSSVLVHPSLTDGFGYVVAEAMASGIPVIATRNTGAAELIVDGKNGYIVRPGDRDELCDRLAHLARNPGLVRELGRAAREAVRSYSPAEFRRGYVSFLEKFAA